jgi:hypothetical protein
MLNEKGGMEMRKISSSLILLSVVFFSMGTLQPGYGMSFGKHHNGGGHANQSITRGNGNGNGDTVYGASLEAQPYPVPVPEPATVVLLASGLLGVGLWRWKKQS